MASLPSPSPSTSPLPSYYYVPIGSASVSRDKCRLEDDYWVPSQPPCWKWLSHGTEPGDPHATDSDEPTLPRAAQIQLLGSPGFGQYGRLFRSNWIRLQFAVCSSTLGVLRVYILPDDVARSTIDREDTSLLKAKQSILSLMDYSAAGWMGDPPDDPASPIPYHRVEGDASLQEMSLLQLFNSLPSPTPDPSTVSDTFAQNAMYCLLESKVNGLKSDLYPYQRRSSALMLQKESQPGKILDPRLQQIRDQDGKVCYLDPVAGNFLLEPRYYDGTSGGILAEEMGSGKTLMCLALILATKDVPAQTPEIFGPGPPPRRPKIASLADMAASCATRNCVPWKSYFDSYTSDYGWEFSRCEDILRRNPGYYSIPAPEPRRCGRHRSSYFSSLPPKNIYGSAASLVVVPNNLLTQWRQEIQKHTDGLKALVLSRYQDVPPSMEILQYDLVLISQSRFEMIVKSVGGIEASPISSIHFKRCIVDEGHKLGNSRISGRSLLLTGLNQLHCTSRWIVTGTPSHGLFGQEKSSAQKPNQSIPIDHVESKAGTSDKTSNQMEMKDLGRIGSITALYLKARPWANTSTEQGDTVADWTTYLTLPKHSTRSRGRWDCLSATLSSLIIRHQIAEIGELLPPVNEEVVYLEGSYFDQLGIQVFSMMIIFNAVQSQRTDQDYFFHPKQKSSLLRIVHNLKQTSFFGGSFFSAKDIEKAVETAEQFLTDKKVACSAEDEELLRGAIELGRVASCNELRNLSNQYHDMPVCVEDFPANAGSSWCLGEDSGAKETCTSGSLLLALQNLVYKTSGDPAKFNTLINGGLAQGGSLEKSKLLEKQSPSEEAPNESRRTPTLAGNTKIGHDDARKRGKHISNRLDSMQGLDFDSFSRVLGPARITATVSAKLSYLLDSIVKYQDEEKIIIFYEDPNIAWYLASMLEVIQVQHLIYDKTLSVERRSQYINTFNNNPKFRVLLMDLSQAAFGLDMRNASRVYFISPVLNPQVAAQAIGRVRRISQNKPVSVETLVLRNSLDEVILDRKLQMTQDEHRQTKSILDIPSIYNWIKNAKITPLPQRSDDEVSQMSRLSLPHHVFGRGFGQLAHPDDGLVPSSPVKPSSSSAQSGSGPFRRKRRYEAGPGADGISEPGGRPRPRSRVTFFGR